MGGLLPPGAPPPPASLEAFVLCAEMRFLLYLGLLVALKVKEEWTDNNAADHAAWERNLKIRSERFWARELASGPLATALDAFRPEQAPFAPRLERLWAEAQRMQ